MKIESNLLVTSGFNRHVSSRKYRIHVRVPGCRLAVLQWVKRCSGHSTARVIYTQLPRKVWLSRREGLTVTYMTQSWRCWSH